MCVRVCVRLGLEVVAAGREHKQRKTTLNSCGNKSNPSLTGTLCEAKELISILETTKLKPKDITQHQIVYYPNEHDNQPPDSSAMKSSMIDEEL